MPIRCKTKPQGMYQLWQLNKSRFSSPYLDWKYTFISYSIHLLYTIGDWYMHIYINICIYTIYRCVYIYIHTQTSNSFWSSSQQKVCITHISKCVLSLVYVMLRGIKQLLFNSLEGIQQYFKNLQTKISCGFSTTPHPTLSPWKWSTCMQMCM